MKTASVRVGNRRLLKLARFLERLPPKRFNYNTYVGADWKGDAKLCGTTACAIGWATTIPEFRKLGLRLDNYGDPYGCSVDYHNEPGTSLFAITDEEWGYLFIPQTGPLPKTASAKQVAKHIRNFVAGRS